MISEVRPIISDSSNNSITDSSQKLDMYLKIPTLLLNLTYLKS